MIGGPKPSNPSGLTRNPQSLGQQQAQFDKNMAQAQALPAAQRAQFAQQAQRAAANKDPSTIRPGTTMGKPGGMMSKMKAGGGVGASKMGAVKTGSGIDGVAAKGKTKGTMVKMAKGGKAC
jgi:hypothetical protein